LLLHNFKDIFSNQLFSLMSFQINSVKTLIYPASTVRNLCT